VYRCVEYGNFEHQGLRMALKEMFVGKDVQMIWFLSEHMAYRNYKSFCSK
jgi:hypothetical protein